MPYFSIILPTFNRAYILSMAIESVLTQTFEDWELIIVDDGSTDNTKELVASYKDSRIVYISQENQERSAARNNGINKVKGEYICFLDSDDYFLPKKLSNYKEVIEKTVENCSVLYDGLLLEEKGKITASTLAKHSSEKSIHEFLLLNPIGPLQMCIPATLLKDQQFNPLLRIGEDVELWLRLVENTDFIPVNSFETVAVQHEDRSVNLKKYNAAKEQLKQLKLIFQQYNYQQISNQVRSEVLSNCYFNSAKHYMMNDEKWRALKNVLRSLYCDPGNIQFKHRIYTLYKLLTLRIPQEYKIE